MITQTQEFEEKKKRNYYGVIGLLHLEVIQDLSKIRH